MLLERGYDLSPDPCAAAAEHFTLIFTVLGYSDHQKHIVTLTFQRNFDKKPYVLQAKINQEQPSQPSQPAQASQPSQPAKPAGPDGTDQHIAIFFQRLRLTLGDMYATQVLENHKNGPERGPG